MNAKTKIELVPDSAQRLRDAIKHREEEAAQAEEIRVRAERLAPLEAEVAAAESELQGILAADAAAIREWADGSASTLPPDRNAAAREEAARKLQAARSRLQTGRQIEKDIEQQYHAAIGKVAAAGELVKQAECDALGEEMIRACHARREAVEHYLAAEDYHGRVYRLVAGFESAQSGAWLGRSSDLSMPNSAEDNYNRQVKFGPKFEARIAAILTGAPPPEI